MFHTIANTVSAAASTLTDLTPVPDEIMTIENAHFLPAQDLRLYGAFAMATDLQRVRFTTPKLRQISPVFVRPIQPTLIGGNNANVALYDRAPLILRGQEEIVVEGFQDNVGAQRITVVSFLGQNLTAVPPGDVYPIRATSVTAVTANAWSLLTYTLDQQLPAGRYACVLVEHISANSQAVRMIFDDQYFRPGAPGLADVNNRLPSPWYEYPLGVYGYFRTFSLPRVQVLCNGADAAHELYFHVIQVP